MQDIVAFLQNHLALALPLVLAFILLTLLELIRQKQNAAQISPARLTQLMNHDHAAIIDLRNSEQFEQGHIIGAISVPVTELPTKSKKLAELKSKPVVLVCTLGTDSLRTATTLIKDGLNIYVLSGGIRAWREANMPLVKG